MSSLNIESQKTALDMAAFFARTGTPFVVIPAMTQDQYNALIGLLQLHLDVMAQVLEQSTD